MTRILISLSSLGCLLGWALAPVSCARGEEPLTTEQVASQLMATTITLRFSHVEADASEPAARGVAAPAQAQAAQGEGASVSVCSGVSLGERLVVTALAQDTLLALAGRAVSTGDGAKPVESVRARVTLPDGRQAVAWPRVVDEYSGLGLFEAEGVELPALALAETLPAVGASVLAASAAGIDRPVVSQGILSGVDRSLAGYSLPPLLQCDVRTTETTGGAPLVDRAGRLIGVITAVASADNPGGWTYAVPMRHVARLVAARNAEQLVVLRRQRPSLGLRLGAGAEDGTVVVEHVEPEGPAAKAGLAVGDLVLQTDGRRIRSAYQAVMLVLKKQPGDEVEFMVERGEQIRRIAVTLGGAADGPVVGVPHLNIVRVGPRLNVRARPGGPIEVENQARVAELATNENAPGGEAPAATPPAAAEKPDAVELLRKQVEAFTIVIRQLQEQLAERDAAAAKSDERLKALMDEIEKLKAELEAAKKP